jgi:general secretion pathway protein M
MMLAGARRVLPPLVLIFGVIKPLQSARAEAVADIRTYETLYRADPRRRHAGPPAATRRQGTPAAMAMPRRRERPGADGPRRFEGGVRATIADATYDR